MRSILMDRVILILIRVEDQWEGILLTTAQQPQQRPAQPKQSDQVVPTYGLIHLLAGTLGFASRQKPHQAPSTSTSTSTEWLVALLKI